MPIIQSVFIIVFLCFINGCNSLLPSIDQKTKSPWQSFEEAKKSFDKIVPNKTTTKELKLLGFDPFETPNVKVVTYLDITQRFIPNQSIRLEDLPEGVRTCLEAKEACKGYEVTPEETFSKRYGNTVADLLNVRRKTVTWGWRFNALIVLKEALVVYKLWGGEPSVLKYEDKKNPLGPLQDIGKVISVDQL